MSLTNAFNNAVSGLQTSARGVGVTSTNIANALVEGFAARRLQLATASGGAGGVVVAGIARLVDPALAGLHRQSLSDQAGVAPLAGFLNRMEAVLGLPGDAAGLAGRLTGFETALVDAADRPDLNHRLAAAADAADRLVEGFHTIERQLQTERLQADRSIARDVDALNRGLGEVARLNAEITRAGGAGPLVLDLIDDRDRMIAELAQIVPIREMQRPNGHVALYSAGGQMLLDGTQPVRFGFTPSPGMSAGLSAAGGDLSGLTADGLPVSALPGGFMAGGTLGAHFAIRDQQAPHLQGMLDQLATSLIARFQEPGVDPTMPAGSAALFSDAGAALAGPAAPGLAGRLSLDPSVSRQGGAEFWRLRDGLGAAAPGAVGDPAQLQRWLGTLEAPVSLAPGDAARSLSGQLADVASRLGTIRQSAENDLVAASNRQEVLRTAVQANGVDTDAELQNMLMIERSYAANARVLQVTDDLLRRLMEI